MDVRNRGVHPTGAPKVTATAHIQRPAPADVPQNTVVNNDKKSKKKRKWPLFLIGVIILVVVLVGGYFAKQAISPSPINKDKFQAVFLTNGQVYFGRLTRGHGYYKLSDVYYLQNKTGEDTNASDQLGSNTDVELIKLGNEVHGPEDVMIIESSQVLFFENLKNDGNVVKTIQQHQNNR